MIHCQNDKECQHRHKVVIQGSVSAELPLLRCYDGGATSVQKGQASAELDASDYGQGYEGVDGFDGAGQTEDQADDGNPESGGDDFTGC